MSQGPVKVTPEVAARLEQSAREQAMEDKAAERAVRDPLPGPLKDVFGGKQDVRVGPYVVRPFYDADYVNLARIGHKILKLDENEGWVPSGEDAWTLCWMMTRPLEESDSLFESGSQEEAKKKARAEFGKLHLRELAAVVAGVVQQMAAYWATRNKYEPDDGVEAAKASVPPPSSGPPPTGSGG